VPTQNHDDRELVRALCDWFGRSARPLPWRTDRRDPYRALVSELMLQQTQVLRVLEKYEPFVERFPTVRALADADEREVLAAWSGLGYYRRARHLHAAARKIRDEFDGVVPEGIAELRTLPGVGRYTAGAIASICHGQAEPIVDGNVRRVLMRLGGKRLTAAEGDRWAWHRSAELVAIAGGKGGGDLAGPFNEGVMELGATLCTPRGPRCSACPVRAHCVAASRGEQEQIPAPGPRARQRELYCASVLVRDGRGRLLVETRPEAGMWAGMSQAPTLERDDKPATGRAVADWLGVARVERVERFTHQTTHRLVRFCIWDAGLVRAQQKRSLTAARPGARWVTQRAIKGLPLSNAQRRILLGREP
jgi:A/G-specific adenine glycosylase